MNIFERKLHPDSNIGGGDNSKIEEQEKLSKLKVHLSYCHLDDAKKILEDHPTLKEKLDNPEVQEAILKGFIHELPWSGGDKAKDLLKYFPLPEDKVQEAVLVYLYSLLSGKYTKEALDLLESFPLPEDKLKDPKIQEAVFKIIIRELSFPSIFYAKKVLEIIPLPKEKIEEAVLEAIVYKFGYHSGSISFIGDLKNILESFPLPEDKLNDPKIQEAVLKYLVYYAYRIPGNFVPVAINILESFPLPEDKLKDPKIQEVVLNYLAKQLSDGNTVIVKNFSKSFPISENKIQEVVFKYIEQKLSIGHLNDASKILKDIPVPEDKLMTPDIQEATYKCLESFLSKGYIKDVKETLKHFPLQKEKLNTPGIQDSTSHALSSLFFRGHINDAKELLELFPLPQGKVQEVTCQVLEQMFENQNFIVDKIFTYAIDIIKSFPLPQEKLDNLMVNKSAHDAFKKLLDRSHTTAAKEFLESFPVQNHQEIVCEQLEKRLARYEFSEANELLELFSIPEEKFQKAVHSGFKEFISYGGIIDDSGHPLAIGDFLNFFPILKEKLETQEIKEAAHKGFKNLLSHFLFENFDDPASLYLEEFLYFFPLSEYEIHEAVYESLVSIFSDGEDLINVKKLLEYLPLSEDRIQEASYEGLKSKIRGDHIGKAKNLFEQFPVPEEKMQEIVLERLRSILSFGLMYQAKEILESFTLSEKNLKKLFDELGDNNIESQIFIQLYSKQTLDKKIKKVVDIFGMASDIEAYNMVSKILETSDISELGQDMKNLGVKNIGEIGINQLEQWFQRFKGDILKEDFDTNVLLEYKFANKFFRNYIRFDNAQWKGKEHDFDFILNRYIDVVNSRNFDIEPLHKEYVPSSVLNIDTVSKEVNKDFKYSEQFLNRFSTLVSDIKKAKERYLSKDNGALSGIVKELEPILENSIKELKQKVENVPEKGKAFLEKKIVNLEGINLRSIKNFQDNFKYLSEIKGTENLLRQAVFAFSFAKNRMKLENDIDGISLDNPKVEDVSWVIDFIDHITNQETFAEYFTDKQALNIFEKNINTKALAEELSLMQNQDSVGTTKMQFVPTRGILLEFSGHMADACWADKYEGTIPAKFPNFTSVSMVQNPGTVHERIAGSCLLIETKSTKGEPLLVIRGLNPLENVINGLKVSDFYEKYTSYLKEIAGSMNRKLAIVIDDHSGGSATNRPVLFNYLSSLELRKVNVPYEETEFNGYDITNCTFLVE